MAPYVEVSDPWLRGFGERGVRKSNEPRCPDRLGGVRGGAMGRALSVGWPGTGFGAISPGAYRWHHDECDERAGRSTQSMNRGADGIADGREKMVRLPVERKRTKVESTSSLLPWNERAKAPGASARAVERQGPRVSVVRLLRP